MTKRVQFIRHVKSAADLFKGFLGEITVNTTDNALRVHDGATVGGTEQAKADLANVDAATAGNDGKMTAAQAVDVAANKSDISAIETLHIGVGGIEHPDVIAGGADGFMTGGDKTKLDGIESGAKDDLTGAEILALLLGVDGAGSGLDADLLDGLDSAAAATVDTVMIRDAAGRGKVVDGAVAGDIATKGQMDTADLLRALKTTTITPAAVSGLAGGGSLSANRTFNLDINSLAADAIAAGDLIPFEDISGGADNKATAQSIANLAPAPEITASFTSAEQTITAAGPLTLAHSLSAAPVFVQVRLKCTTAEFNYSVGDEIIANSHMQSSGTGRGVSVVPDATNLNIRYGSFANTFSVLNKTTGAEGNITNASWKMIVRAWV